MTSGISTAESTTLQTTTAESPTLQTTTTESTPFQDTTLETMRSESVNSQATHTITQTPSSFK